MNIHCSVRRYFREDVNAMFGCHKVSIACLVSVLTFTTAVACKKEEPRTAAFPPATVLAVKAVQKDMPVVVQAIGTIEAFRSVSIYSRVGGQLLKAHFKEGQDVREGQPLFTIDPASYREKLSQAQGKLARDLAQFRYNQEEAKRYAFLFEKGAVSKSEAEKYRTDAAAYEASVKSSEAEVEDARLNLAYCDIAAPYAGRTGVYGVNIGAIVKANDTLLTTLNQITPVHARFSVPEKVLSDVKRYRAAGGVQVKVSPSSDFKGEVRTGKLVFIDNSVDANTGMIQLKAEFSNADRFLWPGQFVNVALQLTVQPNAVVAPLRAVQTGEKGTFVLVVKPDMTAEMRPVVVDWSVGEESVIAKGLAAGETVVTDGHLKVRPGGRVEIKDHLGATTVTSPKSATRATAGGAKP
ncbi:MAG: efflux RND transporter periplasmic adaptor subunit [Pseudomonadota bacterium]